MSDVFFNPFGPPIPPVEGEEQTIVGLVKRRRRTPEEMAAHVRRWVGPPPIPPPMPTPTEEEERISRLPLEVTRPDLFKVGVKPSPCVPAPLPPPVVVNESRLQFWRKLQAEAIARHKGKMP